MKVRLPRLRDFGCLNLTACGQLCADDAIVLSKLRKFDFKHLVARCRHSTGIDWLRMFCVLNGKHLHVDATCTEYFEKGFRPERSHSPSRIQEELKSFFGQAIDVTIIGTFAVPYADVPKRGLVQTDVLDSGKFQVRMTSGSFVFRGLPSLSGIEWRTSSNGSEIISDVKIEVQTVIERNYLDFCLTEVRTAFETFILGKVPDAHAEQIENTTTELVNEPTNLRV